LTNQQAQATPGLALRTLSALILGLVALGVMVYVIATADDSWHAAAAVVWAYSGKRLLDYGVGQVLALGRIEQAKAAKAAENTGVWKAHEAGTFTVRYEPDGGTWHVQGWTGPFTEYRHEVEWADPRTLRTMIEEAEAEGMVPEDDPATRGIRARLMVAGWDDEHGAGIYPASS
jgi:hypothetical protein